MTNAGIYVNNMSGEMAYKSFRPTPLPPELVMDNEMSRLLVEANKQLAILETTSELVPSTDLFIAMYVRKEALISSQIEGTQCTLEDVLDPEAETNINTDVADVINYVKAADYAIERMKTLPICNRLFREIHEVLLSGVRGQEKNPGEFRRSQNWIGASNCALKDARYVPPNVEDMEECMSDLEKYINEDERYDPLIRAALIHYQFETIHPFLDGNGRVGRLLILLYLMEQKLLTRPVIYVSYFMKKNQIEYYDRISEVRRSGNYEQWIRFFLEAVGVAAKDATQTIGRLSDLHNKNLEKIPKPNRGISNAKVVFDYLEKQPIIDIRHTADALQLSYNTVSTAIKKLVAAGILQETTNRVRNRVFVYEAYLNILREGTV